MKNKIYFFVSLFLLNTGSLVASFGRSVSDSAVDAAGHELNKIAVYQNPCTLQNHGVFISSGDFCSRYVFFDGVQCELLKFIFPGRVVISAENFFRKQDIFASYATMVGQKKE